MGLAGFRRARRRHDEEGAGAIYASAPPKIDYNNYVKQDITQKNYCAHCDRYFQNKAAYLRHMQFKHPEDYNANN